MRMTESFCHIRPIVTRQNTNLYFENISLKTDDNGKLKGDTVYYGQYYPKDGGGCQGNPSELPHSGQTLCQWRIKASERGLETVVRKRMSVMNSHRILNSHLLLHYLTLIGMELRSSTQTRHGFSSETITVRCTSLQRTQALTIQRPIIPRAEIYTPDREPFLGCQSEAERMV